jgi:hypothetical protein
MKKRERERLSKYTLGYLGLRSIEIVILEFGWRITNFNNKKNLYSYIILLVIFRPA